MCGLDAEETEACDWNAIVEVVGIPMASGTTKSSQDTCKTPGSKKVLIVFRSSAKCGVVILVFSGQKKRHDKHGLDLEEGEVMCVMAHEK